jgi:hypothetical protein
MLIIPSIVGAIFAAAGFLAIEIDRRQHKRRHGHSK